MASGIMNLVPINTFPGENHPFSPPKGWSGNDEDYHQLLNARWKQLGTRQSLLVAARHLQQIGSDNLVIGPHADTARRICYAIVNQTPSQ